MTRIKGIGAVYVTILLFGLLPTIGHAVVFEVNSTVDAADTNPGDGVCDTGRNRCTLRAAIQERNAGSAVDYIVLPAGVYTLTLTGAGEDAAATGDLDINLPVTIKGLGRADTIIDAAGNDRVFDIFWAGQGVGTQISSITIQNGDSGAGNGGAIRNQGTLELINVAVRNSLAAQGSGGGIYGRHATLFSATTITDSVVSGNQALNAGGGIYGEIVGVSSYKSIDINGSTISDNNVTGADGAGGGIYTLGGPVTVTQSTISGNTALAAGGGIYAGSLSLFSSTVSANKTDGNGGGVYGAGSLALGSVTVTANTAGAAGANGDGGGVYNAGGSINLRQSILAGNFNNVPASISPDCSGSVISDGYNLIGDGTGCTGVTHGVNGDRVGTAAVPIDPQLGALAFNGGGSFTHALAATSLALDAGAPDCPSLYYQIFDQRGATGNSDGDGDGIASCDIGAYELHRFNQRPVARARLNPSTYPGPNAPSRATVVLDGSRSYDPDGRIVSYEWRQISGTTNRKLKIQNADSPIGTFTAPRVPAPYVYQYTFELAVTDTNGVTDTDQITVDISGFF